MRLLLQTLGNRLREMRERRGISQEDFADLTGLHRTEIGLLERGQRMPRLDTLLIMGRGLGVRLTEIVHGIEGWGKVGTKSQSRAARAKRNPRR